MSVFLRFLLISTKVKLLGESYFPVGAPETISIFEWVSLSSSIPSLVISSYFCFVSLEDTLDSILYSSSLPVSFLSKIALVSALSIVFTLTLGFSAA